MRTPIALPLVFVQRAVALSDQNLCFDLVDRRGVSQVDEPERDGADELIERLIRYASFTPLANAAGAPAISLPVAQSDKGLPIAVHFFGNHGDERTLLELAYEIEEARPWRRIQDG